MVAKANSRCSIAGAGYCFAEATAYHARRHVTLKAHSACRLQAKGALVGGNLAETVDQATMIESYLQGDLVCGLSAYFECYLSRGDSAIAAVGERYC